ncbi:3-oxoacyl-ACP reductase [Streptococcus iniae]|uniref:3-ketoacyl-ACP reductase n=2 Tax=Streptococcus iniae TaxID=1346 RepID=A0A3L8GH97_STRIN|nr:3-oxoacyl-ACP reductase [Streptococcus iniae]AGM99265.1 Dehydrogenase [Streptococcus iniae SF1]AHY16201.1 3-ketoacyl-ACP reductase [Streptococcus iniae]AHY18065.1 3-ketoacyl-ACP reductase [Streptococcus iniae]AJG26356.1 3-ketoacyl-ACP reductase [Streptococcus iniae]APD32235.1 3-oxoacyl-ACP reductase [Streptococcus iniae]
MTKTVLVTGVSSGIGLEQARLFLEKGYQVYGVDRASKPDLAGNFTFIKQDISMDLSPIFEQVTSIDILCNTAGVLDAYQPLLEVDMDEFEQVFATNVFAAAKLSQFYVKEMQKQQSGIIINMCSIASFIAGGGGAAYTASKHALAGLTRQLALDYAADGIQVFGIAPGAVKTGMTASDFEPGGLSDWVAEETPIKRWIAPIEVAEVTLFLASGRAFGMQGEILKIDGGWSLK